MGLSDPSPLKNTQLSGVRCQLWRGHGLSWRVEGSGLLHPREDDPRRGLRQNKAQSPSLSLSLHVPCLDRCSTFKPFSRLRQEHPLEQLQLFPTAAARAACVVVINKGNSTVCSHNCALGVHSPLPCRLFLVLSNTALLAYGYSSSCCGHPQP